MMKIMWFMYLLMMLCMLPREVGLSYVVPTTLLSVSTYSSCAQIDDGSGVPGLCSLSNSSQDATVSSIVVEVRGGTNEVAGDDGLLFYGYPPPSDLSGGITSSPNNQDTPCVSGDPGANCSAFLTSDGSQTGPIRIQFVATEPVAQYTLTKLDNIRVPYCYLDHDAPIMWCRDDKDDDAVGGGNMKCNAASAKHVSFDKTAPLLNPWLDDETNGGNNYGSGIPDACRGPDNSYLGHYQTYRQDDRLNFNNPGCYGCAGTINVKYKSDRLGTGGTGEYDHYTTVGSLCPFAAGFPSIVPTGAGSFSFNSNTQFPNGPLIQDSASLIPYYYWCRANAVGYKSYDPDAKNNKFRDNGKYEGQFYDLYNEYSTGYHCSFPPDEDGKLCDTYETMMEDIENGGENRYKCYHVNFNQAKDKDKRDANKCNISLAVQVLDAAHYLTTSCDAVDSGESTYRPTYDLKDKGFSCPGDVYPFVRPNIFNKPFSIVRCSAGCNSRSTVSQALRDPNDVKNKEQIVVSSVMHQKSSIELGPLMCDVYRISPQPRIAMRIQAIITAPDGTQTTTTLDTNGESYFPTTVQGVPFTFRINNMNEFGSAPDVNGLIVMCGTDDTLPEDRDANDQCSGNLDDASLGLDQQTCTTDVPGGVLRGVFPPKENEDGSQEEINPFENPWPELILSRHQDMYTRCKTSDYPFRNDDICTIESITSATKSCAMPIASYLSKLNCGRRVSWYYVPPNGAVNYGTDCGKLGFRNHAYWETQYANFICQQGPSSCTPGYGKPRGGGIGDTFVRSPCQEIGNMVNFNYDTLEDGCASLSTARSANLLPGWVFGNPPDATQFSDEDQDLLRGNVPNYWVDQGHLYKQLSDNTNVNVEIEIFTDTFFGGSYETFVGGTINSTNPLYCNVAVDEADSGELEVIFCNNNSQFGGNYLGETFCGLPASAAAINTTLDRNYTISIDPDVVFQIAPSSCRSVTWGFSVTGPIKIGQTVCETTLYTGPGGPKVELANAVTSCDIQIVTFDEIAGQQIIQGIDYRSCTDFLCKLQNLNRWQREMFYIILALIILALLYLVYKIWIIDWSQRKTFKEQVKQFKMERDEARLFASPPQPSAPVYTPNPETVPLLTSTS